MNNYEGAVFVSYAWGGESESTVNELECAFAERGIKIIRDKKDLNYKGSIEAFEQRIGQGQCVILVISDKYLRSEHCMFELVEVQENQAIRERIFPIVLADALIYKAIDRVGYIKHWDEQIRKLDQAIKEVDRITNLVGITGDLDKYARIRASFDHLAKLLSDMNALTPELHASNGFATLIDAVERVRAEKGATALPRQNHVANHDVSSDSRSQASRDQPVTGKEEPIIIIKIEQMYYNKGLSQEQRDSLIDLFRKATKPLMEKEKMMAPSEMNPEQVDDLYQKSSYTVAYYLKSLTEQQPTLLNRLPGDPKIETAIKMLADIQQQVLLVARVAEIHSPRKYELYQFESEMMLTSIKKLRASLMDLDKYGSRQEDIPSNISMQLDKVFNDLVFDAGRILLLMQELAQPQRKSFVQ